jgi:hypothetical protein
MAGVLHGRFRGRYQWFAASLATSGHPAGWRMSRQEKGMIHGE